MNLLNKNILALTVLFAIYAVVRAVMEVCFHIPTGPIEHQMVIQSGYSLAFIYTCILPFSVVYNVFTLIKKMI